MFRTLEEKDLSNLYKHLNELSDEDRAFFHPHPFTMETLQELLTQSNNHYFIMEKENNLVGYSLLRTFNKYAIPTYGQVIWKKYRGKGYGSEILEKTLQQAKKLGYKIVKLKVFPTNKTAFNLYKKHGFVELSEENGQIWMEIQL